MALRFRRAFVERQRHDARARHAAANVDLDPRAWQRGIGWHVGQADRFLQVRRPGAAGDHTDPHGSWLIAVRLSEPKEIAGLLDAAQYGSLVK